MRTFRNRSTVLTVVGLLALTACGRPGIDSDPAPPFRSEPFPMRAWLQRSHATS